MQLIKIISEYNPGKRINIAVPMPGVTGLERGCVQSAGRSPWKNAMASGVCQQAGFAKLLRLVRFSGTQPRSDVPRSSNLHRLSHIAAIN
jgi:hypothetical protein